jgi:hypothetical protein
MTQHLHLFETVSAFTEQYKGEGYKEPWVSYTKENGKVVYNKSEEEKMLGEYLTFDVISGGNISWKTQTASQTRTIEYSKNGGDWASITSSSSAVQIPVEAGDSVRFRGNNPDYAEPSGYNNNLNYGNFGSSTCYYNARGNIMSLIDSENFATMTEFPEASYSGKNRSNIFYEMFNGSSGIVSASGMILGATVVPYYGYSYMFYGAKSLTDIPKFRNGVSYGSDACYYMFGGCNKITSLDNFSTVFTCSGNSVFESMFSSCYGLTDIPDFSNSTLGYNCFRNMFSYCHGLTSITRTHLSSKTLAPSCYSYMFLGCSGLTTAPDLPATVLATGCYQYMFSGCTSLTTAPVLPAKQLVSDCYYSMFGSCNALTGLTVYAEGENLGSSRDPYTDGFTRNILNSFGVFHKSPNSTWNRNDNQSNHSGIPSSWTVEDIT